MATERFTKDHEWIRLDGGIATVGITDHAQTQLGDVVFVELPDVGREVAQSEAVAVVESVKAASDVFSPIAGEVTEVNGDLTGQPGMLPQGEPAGLLPGGVRRRGQPAGDCRGLQGFEASDPTLVEGKQVGAGLVGQRQARQPLKESS